MHPDFWLVIARVTRPGLIAALGVGLLTLAAGTAIVWSHDPSSWRIALDIAIIASALAAFPLALDDVLPEGLKEREIRGLLLLRQAFYLGIIPVAALRLAQVSPVQLPLTDILAEHKVMVLYDGIMFTLTLGLPLMTERESRPIGRPRPFGPWTAGLLAAALVLLGQWFWISYHIVFERLRFDFTPSLLISALIFLVWVALIPPAIETGRAIVDRLIQHLEDQGRAILE